MRVNTKKIGSKIAGALMASTVFLFPIASFAFTGYSPTPNGCGVSAFVVSCPEQTWSGVSGVVVDFGVDSYYSGSWHNGAVYSEAFGITGSHVPAFTRTIDLAGTANCAIVTKLRTHFDDNVSEELSADIDTPTGVCGGVAPPDTRSDPGTTVYDPPDGTAASVAVWNAPYAFRAQTDIDDSYYSGETVIFQFRIKDYFGSVIYTTPTLPFIVSNTSHSGFYAVIWPSRYTFEDGKSYSISARAETADEATYGDWSDDVSFTVSDNSSPDNSIPKAFTGGGGDFIGAVDTLPEFSGASSFSGGVEVGDTLTAVAGAGTGTASVQWTANNVPISGATSLTYVLQWADRYKSIKPVVTRTNAAGAVADTTVLTPIVCEPKLSSAYFDDASWYDGSTFRWMTPVLVTPYEPGVGGTVKVSNSFSSRQRTFDQRVDFYYRGSLHWNTPGTPIGNAISNSGGRNGVYMGFNTDGYKTQHTRATGDVHFVSLGSDTPRYNDNIFYGGSPTHPQPGNQTTYIQGCRLTPLGTYANPWIVAGVEASGLNEFDILSVTRTGTSTVEIAIDLTSRPSYTSSGGTVTLARDPVVIDPTTGKAGYVILYGVEVSSGVVNALNVDWNTNYDITGWNAGTGVITATMAMDPSDFGPAVSSSAVAGTGKCVALIKKPDNHGDGGQANEGPRGPTYRHGNHYRGNYTVWGIDGNYANGLTSITSSCEVIERLLTVDPQEWAVQMIYYQLSAGSSFDYEWTNTYIKNLWAKVGLKRQVLPNRDDEFILTNGNEFLAAGTDLYPNAIGGVEYDPTAPDQVPADRNFWTYEPTFHGQRNPTNADLTGITFDATAWSSGAAVGTEVGQLILGHLLPDGLNDASGRPVIVDFTISGANAGKVSQGWSGLLYTTASTGGSSFTIDVTATVRDSATNYGAAVTHGPVTITVSPV